MATPQELVKKSEEALAKMLYEQTMLLKAEVEGADEQEPDGDEGQEDMPTDTGHAEPDGDEASPEGIEHNDADSMPTVDELVAEFQQMSPEHLDLFKQAIAQVEQGQAGGAGGGQTPPTTPSPEMGKSEAALKLQAAKELRIAAETLSKREVAPSKPVRTAPKVAPKLVTPTLNKQEIHNRLLSLSKSANTSISDREAINQYYTKGNLNAIKHLLG